MASGYAERTIDSKDRILYTNFSLTSSAKAQELLRSSRDLP